MRALLIACCAFACAGADLSIELKPQATVRAPHATLADVGELSGDASLVEACGAIVVQELPDLVPHRVDAAMVRAALAGRVPARALAIAGECAVSRASRTIAPEAIDEAVRADLAREHAGEREIAITREPAAIVVADDGDRDVELVVEPLAKGEFGELPYRVRAVRGGAEIGRALVVARMRLFRDAPVAAHALRKGDAIGAGDVRVDRVEIVGDDVPAAATPEELLGRVATRDIPDGAVLTAGLVHARPAVRAGQRIALVFSSGAFELSADGTALADAAVGEVVQARRDSDKRLVEARVLGEGRAQVNFK